MLSVRYYIAEKGEVPPQYILLGDSLGLYPNFLEADFDLRRPVVEFDASAGLVYRFSVPGRQRFVRTEEERDSYYRAAPRDLSAPELGIDVATIDGRAEEIWTQATVSAWREEIRYRLGKERVESVGKGLLSLDIPLNLPHSIERIIGRGEETNLTVQGSERIQVSGTSNWCTGCPLSEGRPRQEKFPDLDMRQQLNVNLHGNIGEKINVEIQHSSSGGEGSVSTNRVRLNYKGFDDDVIKLIEMGDTDLNLSGAQLVSYSGTTKGLFGVKGMAQAGPLDLTVIASKEEGETASGSFSASGGQASTATIPDYDYINRSFFYFENPGADFTSPLPGFGTIFPSVGGGEDIDVFVSLTEQERTSASFTEQKYLIKAVPDPENNGTADNLGSSASWPSLYKRLERFDTETKQASYELIQDFSAPGKIRYTGIHLLGPLDETRVLAVRYHGVDASGAWQFTSGTYPDSSAAFNIQQDTIVAELICPLDSRFDPKHPAWRMMMRNVYSLGSSQIDPTTLNVKIQDLENRVNSDIHAASNIPYLRLFGLDRYDASGNRARDLRVDNVPGILDAQNGYILFPWPEPFNPPSFLYEPSSDFDPYIDRADSLEKNFDYNTLVRNEALYDSVLTESDKQKIHRYNLVIESSSGQRTFMLQAYDIIEGSEVVTLDGTRLVRGKDYDIDYTSGTVSLKGDVINEMTPDSRVLIDYQHKPLIGGGKNSLLGVGANLNLSQNSRLSGTFLYSSMGAPKYAPRLGEEPSRTMAADVNGSFAFYPRIMTSLANFLPRVDTNAQSSLTLSGEVALSIPNPNVKGEALVDDMEGIEEENIVGVLRSMWYESSPLQHGGATFDTTNTCEFYWFNPAKTETQQYFVSSKKDLNPRLDDRENSSITSLFFDPVKPGAGGTDWCGITTGFTGGIDLTTAQYLEIWVNDYDPDELAPGSGATIHVDFGWIDENFRNVTNKKLDDEAKPPYYTWTADDDIGFDGDPGCTYPDWSNIGSYWDDSKFVYTGINCRRGNGIHDTEDINGNGLLDRDNDYYTFSFNLADSADIDIRRDYPPSDPMYGDYWAEPRNKNKHWRLYRLDLAKADNVGARTRLDKIQHMRIWIEDPDRIQNKEILYPPPDGTKRSLLEIAQLQFVGSRWEANGVRRTNGAIIPVDSLEYGQRIIIGAINNKDDPALYRPPYAVPQEEGIENREQSLRLRFENFADTTAFSIVKRFFGQGQSYQQYRSIQFFVSPDDSVARAGNVEFYLQIAYDSMSYYEVAVPFVADDGGRWLWVNISLSDLTNLKLAEDGSGIVEREIQDEANGRVYRARLRGNPTLFQVRALYAGLRNRSGRRVEGGEVWFDDLRLGGVRRDIDAAERVSFAADFAGILNLTGSWQRTGPEYRSLRQSSGSGVTNNQLSLNGKTSLDYFIPTARFDIPVSARYNTASSLPKYVPQSDIEIADPRVREANKTVNNDYSFNVSVSRKGSTSFIMRTLFDNLRLGYSYSKRELFSPSTRDTSISQGGNLNYQLHFKRERRLGLPMGLKWRYWLSNLSFESSLNDRIRHYQTLTGSQFIKQPSTREGGIENSFSTAYEPFDAIKLNFDAREQRTLARGHYAQSTYGHSIRMNYQPGGNIFIISQFNPRFDFNSRYSEDLRPTIRQGKDPWGTRNASNQRDMNVVFDFDIGQYAADLGALTGVLGKGEGGKRARRASDFQSSIPQQKLEWEKRMQGNMQPPTEGAGEVNVDETEPPATPPASPPTTPPPAGQTPPGAGGLGVKHAPGTAGEPSGASQGELEGPPAPGDTTAAAAAQADTARARKYNAFMPLKPFLLALERFDPIKTNIRMTHQSSYQRLYERASLLYQLGLSDGAGVPGKLGAEMNEPERSSNNFVVETQSVFAFTDNIDMNIKVNSNVRTEDYSGTTTKSAILTFPVLDVNWRGVEKYKYFAKYLRSSVLMLHFDRKRTRDQRGEEIAYNVTPNWNIEWKNSLSNTVNVTYLKKSRLENFQDLWEKTWAATVGLRYNLSGSKGLGVPLPFLKSKKISFKSTLTTNVDVSYSRTSRYNLKTPSSSLSVQPGASYQFSNSVTGAIGVVYRRSSGGEYGQVNQSLGVDVTAEFRF